MQGLLQTNPIEETRVTQKGKNRDAFNIIKKAFCSIEDTREQ